jgi:ABC-type antimicrobial peptide transport system permease subunit
MGGGLSLRRGLVVFQFVIAQLLVIATIVVVKQMQFFRNSSLGMEKEGIAMINLPSDSSLKVKYPLLKNRLEAINGVSGTSLCMEGPASDWSWKTKFSFDNNPEIQPFELTGLVADVDYFKTFGIKLIAGRLPFASDTMRELVVNEEAVKRLGFIQPRDIVGKTISWDGGVPKPITGVVANFNNRSLHTAQEPLFIVSQYSAYEFIAVRLQKENLHASLESIQHIFKDVYPTYMYDMNFFDKRFEDFYRTEATTSLLFKVFAGLAIFISCLGLYGLVSFMAVQKTKEVGIRKVLGASVQSIVYLFSREFTVLIVIAFLIAAPVGYYFMNQWLGSYYYHIAMGWGVFVLAIMYSVLVAWVAVGYKAIMAALVNPIKSLKTE